MLQQGGHRGTNPLTALPPSPLSLQFPASNRSLSVNIRPTPQILLPMNESLLQWLPVLASRIMALSGITNLSRISSLPYQRTNNPTSQMGTDIPSHRPSAVMTTIATVPPRSTEGVVRGRLLTMMTRTTTPGRPDVYATALFSLSFSSTHDCTSYRMVYGGTPHEGLAPNIVLLPSSTTTLFRMTTR